MPLVPSNRPTERAGVNAAQALFESCGHVFQEVDLRNDYGKDAYVDLVDGREVTGFCVAIQIKSGISYRRASGYGIPIDPGHLAVWRQSTLPVAGIVHDPESGGLYWCNITSFLDGMEVDPPAYIPLDESRVLTPRTLETEFKPEFRRQANRRSIGSAFLQLCSQSEVVQLGALSDCFAVARTDPRVLVVVRHLLGLLTGEALRHALWVLASAVVNPYEDRRDYPWIPQASRVALKPYLRWARDELSHLFALYGWDEWQRDQPARDLFILLCQDPRIGEKLEGVANDLLSSGVEEPAFAALYLSVYFAGEEGERRYWEIVDRTPAFRDLGMTAEVEAILSDCGSVSMY